MSEFVSVEGAGAGEEAAGGLESGDAAGADDAITGGGGGSGGEAAVAVVGVGSGLAVGEGDEDGRETGVARG